MILEVLEVLGDDLETFPGMKAAKRGLERGLRVQFCRFCEIFEILRIPLGAIWGQTSDVFSDSIFDHFLMNFWEGPAAVADLPEPRNLGLRAKALLARLRGGGGS